MAEGVHEAWRHEELDPTAEDLPVVVSNEEQGEEGEEPRASDRSPEPWASDLADGQKRQIIASGRVDISMVVDDVDGQ